MRIFAVSLRIASVSMVVVALAGCGGGDSSTTTAAAPASSAPPAANPQTPNASAGLADEPGGAGAPGAPLPEGTAASGESDYTPPPDALSSGGSGGSSGMMPGDASYDPTGSNGNSSNSLFGGGLFSNMQLSSLGGAPLPSGPTDSAPGADADYMTKAKYAFAIGKEAAAQQYFVAHVLSNDAEAATLLSNVRWSPTVLSPVTTVRFAVGVDLKAPPAVTDVKPVGKPQMGGGAGGGGGGPSAGPSLGPGSGGAPSGNAGLAKSLDDVTGKFGETLVNSFKTAWASGDFGTAFNTVETIIPVPRGLQGQSGLGGVAGMSGAPGASVGGGGMLGAGVASDGGGSIGAGLSGGSDLAPGSDIGGIGGGNPAVSLAPPVMPGKQAAPGLLYLGTGSQADLLSKAQKEGIDFLFLFEVNVEPRRGVVDNDTRLRLVAVADGKALGASTTINNLKYERETWKGDNGDLEKAVSTVFKKMDQIKLAELPKLEPKHALKRIEGLVSKKLKDPFPVLLEIRLYNNLGLLTNEEKSAAYQLVLNSGAGEILASGSLEERQGILDPLLPAYK